MAKLVLPKPQKSMVKNDSSASKDQNVEGESALSVALKKRRQNMAAKHLLIDRNTDELGNISPEELNDGE